MIFSHNTNQSETFPSFRLSHPVDGYLQLRRSTRRKISGRRHSGRGANWHPNYQGGQKKMAMLITPYIASITGWNFPTKAVE